jgi:hypothetical protein
MSQHKSYRNFGEFYPFYLSEHANRTSRRLHFLGTSIAVVMLIAAVATQWWWLICLDRALLLRAQQAGHVPVSGPELHR